MNDPVVWPVYAGSTLRGAQVNIGQYTSQRVAKSETRGLGNCKFGSKNVNSSYK